VIASPVPLCLRGGVLPTDLGPFATRIGASRSRQGTWASTCSSCPLRVRTEMNEPLQLSLAEILDVLAASAPRWTSRRTSLAGA